MMLKALLNSATIVLLVLSTDAFADKLYKYKNDKGKWVFTDRKPAEIQKVETLEFKDNRKAIPKPGVFTSNKDGKYYLFVYNPYFAPIEVQVKSAVFESGVHREVISANTSKTLYESEQKIPAMSYTLRLGDPEAKNDKQPFLFPVSSKTSHRITQSFNGKFSHFSKPNIYAVDIATPVGTYISAAKAGTVIWVKDDYHMGGRKEYFLDKANYVNILHEDGTYAVYAHILLGSAMVKPGDVVEAGERIARAGSSGYSTGPHLHFVVRKNTGLKTVSVPFSFVDKQAKVFTPQAGMKVYGIDKGS